MMISLLASPSFAAFGFKLDGTLDKVAISHAYFEGEFSRVLPPLETYRQSFPETATREDSIFVYKYLSVIYAANPSTRQKAESFMVQLVKLMPTIELIDLYISDNIEAIFKNVKSNFLKQQEYIKDHDLYGQTTKKEGGSDTASQPAKSKSGSHQWVWWTAGGIGVAAVAVGGYYLVEQSPSPGSKHVLEK